MTEAILVIVSCPAGECQSIATALVTEKLAACVSILPGAKSIYFWQGSLCEDEENLLLIKTVRNSWSNLEKRIKELHSYSVPEILSFSVEAGHKSYLDWLSENTIQRNV